MTKDYNEVFHELRSNTSKWELHDTFRTFGPDSFVVKLDRGRRLVFRKTATGVEFVRTGLSPYRH